MVSHPHKLISHVLWFVLWTSTNAILMVRFASRNKKYSVVMRLCCGRSLTFIYCNRVLLQETKPHPKLCNQRLVITDLCWGSFWLGIVDISVEVVACKTNEVIPLGWCTQLADSSCSVYLVGTPSLKVFGLDRLAGLVLPKPALRC